MIPIPTQTRLEKAAFDNGFDRSRAPAGDWLAFMSSHAPLRVWLTATEQQLFVAFSEAHVAAELAQHGVPTRLPLPPGAAAARAVADFESLHRLLRRAFQLSRSLPNEPLRAFMEATASLPRETEVERLVIQRKGQDIFRDRLLQFWDGRCAVSGLVVPELLRASHIKPWHACANDAERLDVFNGLLLAPNLDAVFDKGFVTVQDDGALQLSPALSATSRRLLGLDGPLRTSQLAPGHAPYLAWHRANLFRRVAPEPEESGE